MTPNPIKLISYMEGKTMFTNSTIKLSFCFYTGLYLVKVENKILFEILFKSEEELNESMDKCKEFLFVEKEGELETLQFNSPTQRERLCEWNDNWKEMMETYDEKEEEDLYTCEEFVNVLKRVIDDISFSCDLCVSETGGYNDFFHCLKCIQEEDTGGFHVCSNCMENNPDGYKEHESDFPGHELQHNSDELMNYYIEQYNQKKIEY